MENKQKKLNKNILKKDEDFFDWIFSIIFNKTNQFSKKNNPIEFYSCILFILLGFGKKNNALAYRDYCSTQFFQIGFKPVDLKIKFNENHTRNKNIWKDVKKLIESGKLPKRETESLDKKDKLIFTDVIADSIVPMRNISLASLSAFGYKGTRDMLNPNIGKTNFWMFVLKVIDSKNIESLIFEYKKNKQKNDKTRFDPESQLLMKKMGIPVTKEGQLVRNILRLDPKNQWALKEEQNMKKKWMEEIKPTNKQLEEISNSDRDSLEKEVSKVAKSVSKLIKKNTKITWREIGQKFNLSRDRFLLLRWKLEAYENLEFKDKTFYPKTKSLLIKKTQIHELTKQMIAEYIKKKGQRNKSLKQRLTIEFVKGKSISEICKSNPEYSKNEILNHIITDKRLPAELKKMENEQYFDSDTKISLAVPLFAVDYYQWEGKKKDEQKVIDLAVAIKKHLGKKNNKTRDIFYTRSTISKITFQKVAKNESIQGMRLEIIIKLILFKMHDQAYNMCVEELKMKINRDIIFCKIYCLIKLNKTKDAKIDAVDFMKELSKRKMNTSHLITDQCIKDETGVKVNELFYAIEKGLIIK